MTAQNAIASHPRKTTPNIGSGATEERERREESPSDGVSSPYGSISVIGRRRDMENAVKAELGFLTRDLAKFDFFGVYDGHGGRVCLTRGETDYTGY
ncbi:hypothetical protein Acr_02g0000910 [Actinidia rufa]|uniref:Protein phosphatase 2C family protein n=1 Tax=Actinidia rufa TaxID=165716 RepID=A0A7J0E5R7_9ERIC|nr:hypothetical protein Acr_02g0000910 [Actinidia rufa]